MDFALRCNSLKCRIQLNDCAVVTTCSHIFCTECFNALTSANGAGHGRVCPACATRLTKPDDAVTTQLNPTEDYKTSLLSGLNPSVIMECAGRGLAFYSYQATQEIIYQEYLAKNLIDKYTGLSLQLDQIISDANCEITSLRNRLSALELDSANLRGKNEEMLQAFNQKIRAHARTQREYDILKTRMLQEDVKHVAEDVVEHTLYSANADRIAQSRERKVRGAENINQQLPYNHYGVFRSGQRSGSSGSGDGDDCFRKVRSYTGDNQTSNNGVATPSVPWTRAPVDIGQTTRAPHFHDQQNAIRTMSTPMARQALGKLEFNSAGRLNAGVHGLNAGLKHGHSSTSLAGQPRSRSHRQQFPLQ